MWFLPVFQLKSHDHILLFVVTPLLYMYGMREIQEMLYNDYYYFIALGKLASRSQRVAHYLLNKLGGGKALVSGDRVSLYTDYWKLLDIHGS